jgi:restriction system protein
MKCASESWRHTPMPVPTYDHFIEPILRYLADHPDGAPARDVHEAAADALGLDTEQCQEMLPSGVQTVYKNRAGWAHDRLKARVCRRVLDVGSGF